MWQSECRAPQSVAQYLMIMGLVFMEGYLSLDETTSVLWADYVAVCVCVYVSNTDKERVNFCCTPCQPLQFVAVVCCCLKEMGIRSWWWWWFMYWAYDGGMPTHSNKQILAQRSSRAAKNSTCTAQFWPSDNHAGCGKYTHSVLQTPSIQNRNIQWAERLRTGAKMPWLCILYNLIQNIFITNYTDQL